MVQKERWMVGLRRTGREAIRLAFPPTGCTPDWTTGAHLLVLRPGTTTEEPAAQGCVRSISNQQVRASWWVGGFSGITMDGAVYYFKRIIAMWW